MPPICARQDRLLKQIAADLIKVENAIDICENDIGVLVRKIDQVEEKLSGPELSPNDVAHWRNEKEQLRKKEEQLRKKEEQLRKEKELLLTRMERMEMAKGAYSLTLPMH